MYLKWKVNELKILGIFKLFFNHYKEFRYVKVYSFLMKIAQMKLLLLLDDETHFLSPKLNGYCSKEKEGRKCTPEQNRNAFRHLLLDAGRPFLYGRTDQFVNELEQFLASGLNIQAYDKVCLQHLTMSSSSETHDKEVCNHLSLDPQRQLIFEDSDDAE